MVFRPHRHTVPDTGEFQDPMDNYAPPVFHDELERALSEDRVSAMKVTPFSTITPGTTILEAMQLMVRNDVACLMVAEGPRLLGIFTERDVLNKVTDRFEQIKHLPVSLVMTHDPAVVYDTDPPAQALNLMAIAGFRHVPILNVNHEIVGILGPRRVVAYLNQHLSA